MKKTLFLLLSILSTWFPQEIQAQPLTIERSAIGDIIVHQGSGTQNISFLSLKITASVDGMIHHLSMWVDGVNSSGFQPADITNVQLFADSIQTGQTKQTIGSYFSLNTLGGIPVRKGQSMTLELHGDFNFGSVVPGGAFTSSARMYFVEDSTGDGRTIGPIQGQVNYVHVRGTRGPEVILDEVVARTDSSFTYAFHYDPFGIPTDIWPEISTAGQYNFLAKPKVVVQTVTQNTGTVTVSGLDPESDYTFRMVAEDANYESYSAVVSIETRGIMPNITFALDTSLNQLIIAPQYQTTIGSFTAIGDTARDGDFQLTFNVQEYQNLENVHVRVGNRNFYVGTLATAQIGPFNGWVDEDDTINIRITGAITNQAQAGDTIQVRMTPCIMDDDDGFQICKPILVGYSTVISAVSQIMITQITPYADSIIVAFNYSDLIPYQNGDIDYGLWYGLDSTNLDHSQHGNEQSNGSGTRVITVYNVIPDTTYYLKLYGWGRNGQVQTQVITVRTQPLPKLPPTGIVFCPDDVDESSVEVTAVIQPGNQPALAYILYGKRGTTLTDTVHFYQGSENDYVKKTLNVDPLLREVVYYIIIVNDSGYWDSDPVFIRLGDPAVRTDPSTLPAESITQTTATFVGVVEKTHLIPYSRFVYWNENDDINKEETSWLQQDGYIEFGAGDLESNIMYFYRLEIQECGEIYYGNVQKFVTSDKTTGMNDVVKVPVVVARNGSITVTSQESDVLDLYDFSGRRVTSIQVLSGVQHTENLSLSPGMYLYRMREIGASGKMVVQ